MFFLNRLDLQPISGSFILKEVCGNLLSTPSTNSLAHCVSSDFWLKQGIAKQFLFKFPLIKTLSGIVVGKIGVIAIENKFIYNLVTKVHYYDKPTYSSVQLTYIT